MHYYVSLSSVQTTINTSLTSVWVVEDHQFSVSFSDLIPVGCGAERDKSIQTIRATH